MPHTLIVSIFRKASVASLLSCAATLPTLAANQVPIHPANTPAAMRILIVQNSGDIVRDQRWDFLRAALDHTVGMYGPYVLDIYRSPMTAQREINEVISGRLINVIASDVGHPDLNEETIPVPIPIDKGMLGYRVALIRSDDQARVDLIKGIDDLRSFRIGQGQAWGDLPIYEVNRIPVVTSSQYALLFAMLARGRFDLFPRGATEITAEFNTNNKTFPALTIDRHLLIHYTYAQFFYVNKDFPLIAQRIKDGLELMIKDGSFDRLFDKHFGHELQLLHLKDRVDIELVNPFVPPWLPVNRKSLWLNPLDYK